MLQWTNLSSIQLTTCIRFIKCIVYKTIYYAYVLIQTRAPTCFNVLNAFHKNNKSLKSKV